MVAHITHPRVTLAGCMARSTSQRQRCRCTKCQEAVGQGAASHGRSRRRMRRGTQEISESGVWHLTPGGRNQGFRLLFWILLNSQMMVRDGAGECDGGEFNSPRRAEENRGRQSAARGDSSTTKTRSRSRSGDERLRMERVALCEVFETKSNRRGSTRALFATNSLGEDPSTFV